MITGLTVGAVVATRPDLVRLARELRPDVVIMDVTMPRLNGIEAMRQDRDAYDLPPGAPRLCDPVKRGPWEAPRYCPRESRRV